MVEILCAFKDLVGARDEIRLNSLSNFLASFLKSESRRAICLSKSVFLGKIGNKERRRPDAFLCTVGVSFVNECEIGD